MTCPLGSIGKKQSRTNSTEDLEDVVNIQVLSEAVTVFINPPVS